MMAINPMHCDDTVYVKQQVLISTNPKHEMKREKATYSVNGTRSEEPPVASPLISAVLGC
jgi:hypothetical protein